MPGGEGERTAPQERRLGALRRRLSALRPPPAPASPELCRDLRAATREVRPASDGCAQCRVLGESWTHLRLCLTCGHVGCCDSDRNQHATRHWEQTGHPVMRSHEPGQSWRWCYRHEQLG